MFAALYFCEGAPIGYLWWTLPVLLRTRGVASERITTVVALATTRRSERQDDEHALGHPHRWIVHRPPKRRNEAI